ncbi:MAG TPA: alkaline phosphatase family protein [Actinomycetota bacterium]|nr:alkaline phosphatase family protein [Actinomycetota bacterium]
MRIGELSLRRRRQRRRRLAAAAVALAVVAAAVLFFVGGGGEPAGPSERRAARRMEIARTELATDDPVRRGCSLPKDQIVRIWRGWDPVHSEDVTTVPWEPNYSGSLNVTSHTGPWDYLQNVPLVLYGPRRIRGAGVVDRHAELVDVFATVGELVGVDLPRRDGDVLRDALAPNAPGVPKLVLVVMWDGVGRNVLERWPGRWPTLARLSRAGTSYLGASVGSSPSITPATHANLGTGAYPRDHKVTAITYRLAGGVVRNAFADRNPADMKLTTFADEIDAALDNAPLVGMLAWRSWHLGMFGHGTQSPGGDADQLALMGTETGITGEDAWYSTPPYVNGLPGIERYVEQVDRLDGKADGKWLGHDVEAVHDNPAWIRYQRDVLLAMLEREGYGADEVPDLFLTNFKVTDIVGHNSTMDSKEMGEVLAEQDAALGEIVDYLDREVRDYVVIVSADHGHTPDYERSGAFPIAQSQIIADVNRHFDVPKGESLFRTTSAAGPFLQRAVADELGVTEDDVARFLNGYTIDENWKEAKLPPAFEDRAEEPIFSAAFSGDDLDAIVRCAFGSGAPPKDFEA